MIGFIGTLYTQLGTTGNCSAIADLHTLQLTVTQVLVFSVFTSHNLATDLSQSHCNFKSHWKSSFRRLNSFLAFSSQSPWTAIYRTGLNSRQQLSQMNSSLTELFQLLTATNSNNRSCPIITPPHGPFRKHSFSAFLLIRCLAMDVLLLRALAPAGICLPSRCLALCLYVTIY
jgi:hypothetical protein